MLVNPLETITLDDLLDGSVSVDDLDQDQALEILENDFSHLVEPLFNCDYSAMPAIDFIQSYTSSLKGISQEDIDFVNNHFDDNLCAQDEEQLLLIQDDFFDGIAHGQIYLINRDGNKLVLWLEENMIFALQEKYWQVYCDLMHEANLW